MIFDIWDLRRVSSEEEQVAVNYQVEISKFSPASNIIRLIGYKNEKAISEQSQRL